MARSVGLPWPQAIAENARETLVGDGPKPAAASQGYREAHGCPATPLSSGARSVTKCQREEGLIRPGRRSRREVRVATVS
jgi:hypothetical protein